jgi:hypothetical protein
MCRIGNFSSYNFLNTVDTDPATSRLTMNWPSRVRPSKSTYGTVTSRSCESATGQPACHWPWARLDFSDSESGRIDESG